MRWPSTGIPHIPIYYLWSAAARKKKQTEWAKGEVRSCTVRRRRRRWRRGHGRTREKSGSFFRGRLSLFKEIVARARFIHREREILHGGIFLFFSLSLSLSFIFFVHLAFNHQSKLKLNFLLNDFPWRRRASIQERYFITHCQLLPCV